MSKYRNKNTTIKINGDDIEFDSKAESLRALYLVGLLNNGAISDLVFQPLFEIQAGFRRNKCAVRAIKYIADFAYTKDGNKIIEDVKGVKTAEYQLKKKLFLKKYGDELYFFEVFYKRNCFEVIEV